MHMDMLDEFNVVCKEHDLRKAILSGSPAVDETKSKSRPGSSLNQQTLKFSGYKKPLKQKELDEYVAVTNCSVDFI